MKLCQWCGRENEDDAEVCRGCGTQEFKTPATELPEPAIPATLSRAVPPKATETSSESAPLRWEFRELTPQEMKMDLVTLVRCRTLAEADLVVSELSSAGIAAFIPDEFMSQAVAWNLNTYGYVRVQVAPKDYQAAKEFLLAEPQDVAPPDPSQQQSDDTEK